ncbi:acylphosphatase [Sphingobacterium sp. 1.A.4]|uniref:acylphosphatase n=1 Tax=Sphingobacterium sp. 1.A.4 TaxID=2044603 RepID=UPI000C0C07AC|nr:acylphosphatase [Sphingobacterium sp. 1.A.4]
MKHWNIQVQGKVQGVSFRASTKAVADLLGVKGYVINQPDGSVLIEAEGDAFALESFMEFCLEGPEHAEVTTVQHTEEDALKGYRNFEVIKKIK